MPAEFEYQLFELDRVESEFRRIIESAVSTQAAPVQVLQKRDPQTNVTPRVVLTLSTRQNASQRFILNPSKSNAVFQPRNVWSFNLAVEVVTNRETNASQHLPLCGKCRWAMQMYRLAITWQGDLHTIVDTIEAPIELGIVAAEDTDSSKMNFEGMLAIRNGAWR